MLQAASAAPTASATSSMASPRNRIASPERAAASQRSALASPSKAASGARGAVVVQALPHSAATALKRRAARQYGSWTREGACAGALLPLDEALQV